VGPIDFDQAAIVWAAFYHLMFREDRARMNSGTMRRVLSDVWRTFGVRMRVFWERGDGEVRAEVLPP
jgi:hypothetical protein